MQVPIYTLLGLLLTQKNHTACKTVSDDVDVIINELYRVGEVMHMS